MPKVARWLSRTPSWVSITCISICAWPGRRTMPQPIASAARDAKTSTTSAKRQAARQRQDVAEAARAGVEQRGEQDAGEQQQQAGRVVPDERQRRGDAEHEQRHRPRTGSGRRPWLADRWRGSELFLHRTRSFDQHRGNRLAVAQARHIVLQVAALGDFPPPASTTNRSLHWDAGHSRGTSGECAGERRSYNARSRISFALHRGRR